MVSVLNDLRDHLAGINGAPVAVDVNDHQFTLPASDLLRALGPVDYEGTWCYPIGTPSNLQYPPPSERYPNIIWVQTNYVGAFYKLNGTPSRHTGSDLDESGYLDVGEYLHAITRGHVIYASLIPAPSTWGNVLVIRYELPEGGYFYARFAHLNSMAVEVGQDVIPGQIIGEVGNIGMPTVPHLHWDITKPNDDLLAQNPLDWPSSRFDDAGALAFIKLHYVDPGTFIRAYLVPAPPKPEPAGEWMRVDTAALNYRNGKGTAATIMGHLHQDTLARINGSEEISGNLWGQITECLDAPEAIGYWLARNLMRLDAPVETVKRYVQIAGLNIRLTTHIVSTNIIGSLTLNALIDVSAATIVAEDYIWRQYKDGWVADAKQDGTWRGLLDRPFDPPVSLRNRIGVHVHSTNAPNADVLAMAQEGLLAGVTGLNNAGLINLLVDIVPYVVGRLCLTDHDPMPPIRGSFSDEQLGWDWYYQRGGNFPLYDYIEQLDRKIIIQGVCEQNHPDDGLFYIGFMKAAEKDGRKVVIFNDSVGNPWDSDARNGFGIWRRRIATGCLRHCKANGHFVGYHGYGKPDEYPGSAIGDDEAWKLYGGRVLEAYAITLEDSRPPILYTEAGTNRANYMGPDFTVTDMHGYQTRLADNPYVKAVMYWELGGRGDRSFDRSCMDAAIPQITAYLRTRR